MCFFVVPFSCPILLFIQSICIDSDYYEYLMAILNRINECIASLFSMFASHFVRRVFVHVEKREDFGAIETECACVVEDVTRLNLRLSQIAYNCILMLIAFSGERAGRRGVLVSTAEIQLLVHIITITKFSLLRRMPDAHRTPFKVCFFHFTCFFFSLAALSPYHFVHSGQHLHFIISIKLCCALNFIAQEEWTSCARWGLSRQQQREKMRFFFVARCNLTNL